MMAGKMSGLILILGAEDGYHRHACLLRLLDAVAVHQPLRHVGAQRSDRRQRECSFNPSSLLL
jgi:hypothetical protein